MITCPKCKRDTMAPGTEGSIYCPSCGYWEKSIYDPANLKDGYKNDEGKAEFNLIPVEPLFELAQLYMMGAKKYQPDNWKKGMRYSRCYNALLRHLLAWWNGEDRDPQDGQHHLTSVVWNAMTLLYYELFLNKYAEFDDRPNTVVIADRKLEELTQGNPDLIGRGQVVFTKEELLEAIKIDETNA